MEITREPEHDRDHPAPSKDLEPKPHRTSDAKEIKDGNLSLDTGGAFNDRRLHPERALLMEDQKKDKLLGAASIVRSGVLSRAYSDAPRVAAGNVDNKPGRVLREENTSWSNTRGRSPDRTRHGYGSHNFETPHHRWNVGGDIPISTTTADTDEWGGYRSQEECLLANGIISRDFAVPATPSPVRSSTWRPGDDAIPATESDHDVNPNLPPKFGEKEQTSLKGFKDQHNGKFSRLKKKCSQLFRVSSVKNHAPTSPPGSESSRSTMQTRLARSFKKFTEPDVEDIIKRRESITGQKLKIGPTEINIMPEMGQEDLLYFLMEDGEDLQITINDLEERRVSSYSGYQDDLAIMRWLIDARCCRYWGFSVDNIHCRECTSSWRMKKEASRIGRKTILRARPSRIHCSHRAKAKQFFDALGEKHTMRMTNIKLQVSLSNCLNPDTLASAVHTIVTTIPALEKVEVEFQHDVSLCDERILRSWRRRSIARSLRQLEKWVEVGHRLKVTGLDAHPRLVSEWNGVKRRWHYDADQTVRFLWESKPVEPNMFLKRRASWPVDPVPWAKRMC